MFGQVMSLSKQAPKQQASAPAVNEEAIAQCIMGLITPAVNEDAIAQNVVGLIIPSLDSIIEKAVKAALRMPSTEDASRPIHPLGQAFFPTHQSNPVEIGMSKDPEIIHKPHTAVYPQQQQHQPVKVNICNVSTPIAQSPTLASAQCQSKPVEINVLDANLDSGDDDDDDLYGPLPSDLTPTSPTASSTFSDKALDHIRALIKNPDTTWSNDAQ